MKNIMNITLLLVFFATEAIHAQTMQTADSSLGVYPLQVGNLWQYWTYDYLNGQYIWIYGWSENIERDSILSNGLKYSLINSTQPLSKTIYLRQDSSKIFQYNNGKDSLIYNFKKHPIDTISIWPVGISDTIFQLIVDEGYMNYFDQNRKYWTYYTYYTNVSYYERKNIVDGIGVGYQTREGGDEWFLRGAIINGVKYGTITSIQTKGKYQHPSDFELIQNYPNPFNASTIISFQINNEQNINFSIYDLLGRRVATLINNKISSGVHKIVWKGKSDDGKELSSGLYIYRIQTQTTVKQKKMLMIK